MLKHTKRRVKNKMRFIIMLVAAVCFMFLIKLKWPKSKNIYDGIFKFDISRIICLFLSPLVGMGGLQRNTDTTSFLMLDSLKTETRACVAGGRQ